MSETISIPLTMKEIDALTKLLRTSIPVTSPRQSVVLRSALNKLDASGGIAPQ